MNKGVKAIVFILLWIILFLGALYFVSSYNLLNQNAPDTSGKNPLANWGIAKDPNGDKIYATIITPYSPQSSFKENPQDEPIEISIPKILVDSKVNNPTDINIDVLNNSLLSGAVHYPGSGTLADESNILIFGHSSHLAVVINQNYKIFNRLNELSAGDLIYLQSSKEQNVYKVKSVSHVNSEDTTVDFASKTKKLTLVSCDNFGAKQDRYVVDAEFISSKVINNR